MTIFNDLSMVALISPVFRPQQLWERHETCNEPPDM